MFEHHETNLPGSVQWKIDACGEITCAFQCPWPAGYKEPPPLLPGRVGGSWWGKKCFGSAVFLRGQRAHSLRLGGRRRVWGRSQEHPQMRGTCWLCRGTWSTVEAAGRRLDFPATSCLQSPGFSLTQWPVRWGWWQGLPVFPFCRAASLICCPCLRRLPLMHPHTHSLAPLDL